MPAPDRSSFHPTTETSDQKVPAMQGASCAGDFRRACPNCGATLRDKECKSRCPRCHFFTDCSDPW